ncbi:MAG TPA: tetratricopeptide repeat protein [Kofleriaceae bacterium]|jgi:tetratricopeptide (TPR) repeat protein|nr:tetratricopeptide repeat protein [Kofleriaceae bacterium]
MGELVSIFSLGPRRDLRRATSAIDHYERGLALEAAGELDTAMAAYGRAIAGRPDLADAYNNLGRIHHDRGELADAESLYRLAICAAGTIALYWFNLGVALEDAGRHAEAVAAYERALALDNSLADAHFNLARQLERAAGSACGRPVDEIVLRRAVRHLARYRDLARHQPIFK